MIKKITGLIVCLSLVQALASSIQPGEFSFDGARIAGQSADGRTTVSSLTAEDRPLFEQEIIAARSALPVEEQSRFPSGTFNFQINAATTRIESGIKFHAVKASFGEADARNSLIAGIGALPRNGYTDVYLEINGSLLCLGRGDDQPGIVNFSAFVHPEANPEALQSNLESIVNLIRRLAADQERLPEERSEADANIKIRAVPGYIAAFFHPEHPVVPILDNLGFVRLKDSSGRDSHAFDPYIDGPVDECVKRIKEECTATALLAQRGPSNKQILAPDVSDFFKRTQGLPWRTTFLLPLTKELEGHLSHFVSQVATQSEYNDDDVNTTAVDMVFRKLEFSDSEED